MKMLSLRLPDELHAALKKLAEKEHRSLHAEIIHALWVYVEQFKTSK